MQAQRCHSGGTELKQDLTHKAVGADRAPPAPGKRCRDIAGHCSMVSQYTQDSANSPQGQIRTIVAGPRLVLSLWAVHLLGPSVCTVPPRLQRPVSEACSAALARGSLGPWLAARRSWGGLLTVQHTVTRASRLSSQPKHARSQIQGEGCTQPACRRGRRAVKGPPSSSPSPGPCP